MNAAGFLSLLLLDTDGKTIPANVQRFDELGGAALPSPSPALMLATLMFEALTAKQQDRIRRIVRGLAYSPSPLPDAVALHNALRFHALNGRSK
jgi:hypothetical protein